MARRPAPPVQVGLAVVLLLLGFLVSSAFVQQRIRERELPERSQALRTLVAERQEAIDRLISQSGRLDAKLGRIQEQAGRGSKRLRRLVAEVNRLRAGSGLAPLRGPGVVVTLEDSERAPATRAEQADLVIQDVDLQLVVNELWRAGAEAVAVNGRRVVSTTAIREAGGAILVNYGAVASPYRVVALGRAESLARRLTGSQVARRFQVWTQVYGLGFDVSTVSSLRVPALSGIPVLSAAAPEAP
jgi:uncharacterized protein YlxW (UPF0749 family)